MKFIARLFDKPASRWLLWGTIAALWTAALLVPPPDSEEWDLLQIASGPRELLAKGLHFFAYGILAVLSGWVRVSPRGRLALLFLLMAHAAVTEWLQTFLSYRTGEVRDVVLDHLGILAGLILSWKWWGPEK